MAASLFTGAEAGASTARTLMIQHARNSFVIPPVRGMHVMSSRTELLAWRPLSSTLSNQFGYGIADKNGL